MALRDPGRKGGVRFTNNSRMGKVVGLPERSPDALGEGNADLICMVFSEVRDALSPGKLFLKLEKVGIGARIARSRGVG